MSKAILVIGDSRESIKKPAKSFLSFIKHLKNLTPAYMVYRIVSYNKVLDDKLPVLDASHIYVVLFFPFEYWNKNIEVYKGKERIYGNMSFGRKYKEFFKNIEKKIRRAYRGKRIEFLNEPTASVNERDKFQAKRIFNRNSIATPRKINVRHIGDIEKIVQKGKPIYAKPRFGAMGKGITYIDRDMFITNFAFKNDRIFSKYSDFGWKFKRVRGKKVERLINSLVRERFVFEESIAHPVYRNKRFDFRVHVVYGKTPYYYIKTMPSVSPITNWTQGGRIEKKKNFKKYIKRNHMGRVIGQAKRVAKALGLNYAGIDIVLTNDYKTAYCLEAHSFPGYEKGFDIMKYLVKDIIKRLRG